MRDMLFRGKLKSNLEWFYGDKITELSTGKVFIADLAQFNEHTKLVEIMGEVIPETVGQFTGKLDKNGKKIFEGDIVKIKGWGLSTVRWFTHDAMFLIEGAGFQYMLGVWNNNEREVVGNIHEEEQE